MNNYFDDKVPEYILRKSNLSWEERQLIEYVRRYPEKLEDLKNELIKAGETK